MYFTEENLLSMVNTATDKFNVNERYLIENDLSERCICARFAMYLQNELSDSKDYRQYVVDVEYNRGGERKQNNPKMLFNKKIVVDLIAHKRGFDGGNNNLICCEMKKSTDRRGCTDDEKRLRYLTDSYHGFNYKLGVMLLIDMKNKELRIKQVFGEI